MEPEGSSPHSQVPANCPYPEPARSIYTPTSQFLKIHLNIILPSTLGSPKWSLSSKFLHQNSVYASPLCLPCSPQNLILEHFVPMSYQSSSPGPRQVFIFSNKSSVYGEYLLAPRPTPPAGGPPLVGWSLLLIQYIRSYPPYCRPFLHPQPEDAPCRGDRDPLCHGSDLQFLRIIPLSCI